MEPPAQYLCPISRDIMQDPVLLVESGQTYERSFIEQWFARGNQTDPLSGARVSDMKLASNVSLRSLIQEWMEKHKEHERLGIAGIDVPLIAQERLVLGDVLHRGTMAVVHEAFLAPTGQEVVVKMFHARGLTDDESGKFRQEVQILHEGSVFCHNVCRLMGVAVIHDQLCMVMPRYKSSLEQVLLQQGRSVPTGSNAAAGASRGLPLNQILCLGQDIALAIADLHARRILVLDLKPANVLLDDYGRALVADFGISKLRNSTMSRCIPTHDAQGTPNYMAPEQWLPQDFRGITEAADAWGFGCLLVEMASGTAPWAGMVLWHIMNCVTANKETPSIPPSLPSSLKDLLRRCFAYQPAERPTFAEILEELRQCTVASPPAPPAVKERPLDASSTALLRDMDTVDDGGQTSLHRAAKEGRLDEVQLLVAHGSNKEAKDADGWTPLHVAAQNGRLDVVKHLVASGANKEATNKTKATPLHIASRSGHLDVVKHLIASGGDKEATSKDGRTPLHIASSTGHLDVVKHLVESGANMEATSKNGDTPLFMAAQSGDLDVVKHLVASGANIDATNKSGATPLYVASKNGHVDVAEHLAASGASKEARDKGAVGQGALQQVAPKPQPPGVTPRAPPRAPQQPGKGAVGSSTPVAPPSVPPAAADRPLDANLLAMLRDMNIPDSVGQTPLHREAQAGIVHRIQLLVAHGANVEARTKNGTTPLHNASEYGRLDALKHLLASGANKNAAKNDGATPLHLASKNGHLPIVKHLVAIGADMEARDKNRVTPLHIASFKGRLEVVQFLVANGAIKEAKDRFGKTVLAVASTRAVRELLQA